MRSLHQFYTLSGSLYLHSCQGSTCISRPCNLFSLPEALSLGWKLIWCRCGTLEDVFIKRSTRSLVYILPILSFCLRAAFNSGLCSWSLSDLLQLCLCSALYLAPNLRSALSLQTCLLITELLDEPGYHPQICSALLVGYAGIAPLTWQGAALVSPAVTLGSQLNLLCRAATFAGLLPHNFERQNGDVQKAAR